MIVRPTRPEDELLERMWIGRAQPPRNGHCRCPGWQLARASPPAPGVDVSGLTDPKTVNGGESLRGAPDGGLGLFLVSAAKPSDGLEPTTIL
jgi:hypothetical protein